MMENSNDFDSWLTETVGDLANFTNDQLEYWSGRIKEYISKVTGKHGPKTVQKRVSTYDDSNGRKWYGS